MSFSCEARQTVQQHREQLGWGWLNHVIKPLSCDILNMASSAFGAGSEEFSEEWADGDEAEQPNGYNLLCEENPDEFVNIEIPSDVLITRNQGVVPPSQGRSHSRLVSRLRKSPSPQHRRDRMEPQQDISQLNADENSQVFPLEPLSVPPESSTLAPPGARASRDASPLSSSVGSSPSREGNKEEDSDPTLRSDMLLSLTASMAEMSIRQSLHIGVGPSDLVLPSNEEIAKKATRVRMDSMGSESREYEDEDVESITWSQHQKHVFILSTSGKPVYSRYGKEEKLVHLFGIMQVLVSFVQDNKDSLRSIVAGDHRIVFVCRGPLVFVAVAKSRLSENQLALQLMYAYYQILSVLTNTQLQQIFERNPGFDLRYLLQGSEKFVDNILKMVDTDPSFLFSAVRCLAMPINVRQTITTTLMQCRTKDVLFAVLVACNQLITYLKPKEHNLLPLDVHLIFNLVDASTSFRSAESWTPLCLPKFNDTGFLHAHVSYLPYDSPACLLLISTDKEKFFALQECQQKIFERLEKQNCLEAIKQAVLESPYTIDHLQAPEIRHFLYKSRKTSCITSPKVPIIYHDKEDKDRLFELYMLMHQKLHSHSWPIKILYHVGDKEALLGWRTAGFDLYAVFDPLIAKAQAILLGNKLIRWINKEEERLIITSSHTF